MRAISEQNFGAALFGCNKSPLVSIGAAHTAADGSGAYEKQHNALLVVSDNGIKNVELVAESTIRRT